MYCVVVKSKKKIVNHLFNIILIIHLFLFSPVVIFIVIFFYNYIIIEMNHVIILKNIKKLKLTY